MAVLRDPKLEKFAQALYSNLIAGMRRSEAADQAAEVAGYKGSSRAANARKRAQREDVVGRLLELGAPATAKAAAQIEATREWATGRLVNVCTAVELDAMTTSPMHLIAAIRLLGQMNGWLAPDRIKLEGFDLSALSDDEIVTLRGILARATSAPAVNSAA